MLAERFLETYGFRIWPQRQNTLAGLAAGSIFTYLTDDTAEKVQTLCASPDELRTAVNQLQELIYAD